MTGETTRPRVVHVTTTDMSLDWLLGPQLRAFVEAGYEVVGVSAPGPHVPAIEAMGVRHVALTSLTRSFSLRRDARALVDLARTFRELQPDIVHTHNPKPGVLGRIAARLVGVPLIVNTQHGLYAQPTDRRRRRWPVYAVERVASSFGHLELVQNEEDVDTLVHRLRIPARKVRLLGNGVDLARFDPLGVAPDGRARLRLEWGVSADAVVAGVVARLVREKGIVELLAAAERLGVEAPNVRVVIVGPVDVAKSDALDAAAIEQARANGVVFAGEHTDMPECYSAMDLFVTASWREGFPRSAMEAAAMGLPTVASDIRGNRQVVADGLTGLLVAVRDSDALAAGVAALAGDPPERTRLGEAARERAIAEFDDRRVIDRTLAAYEDFRVGPIGG